MLAISIYSALMHSNVFNGFLKIGDKDKLIDWMFSYYVILLSPDAATHFDPCFWEDS